MEEESVAVIGLGRIGLPLAVVLASSGLRVVGLDRNEELISRLSKGLVHLEEGEVKELFRMAGKNLEFTTSYMEAAEKCNSFIIAVPTPISGGKPDLRYVESACEDLVSCLLESGRREFLIVIESTLPPGGTELVARILSKHGLEVGRDCYLAYCPERAMPGRTVREIIENPRLIGVLDDESARRAKDLYSRFVKGEITVVDARVAEIVKLAENAYRDVNIAFANELALICQELGVNVFEVIELANKHPRVNIHVPGCGVGGPCLTKDPLFLTSISPANLIETARRLNESMPSRIVGILERELERLGSRLEECRVAILGFAYKANVSDTRESPGLKLAKLLDGRVRELRLYDPLASVGDPRESKSLEDALRGANLAIVTVEHREFKRIPELALMDHPKLVFDCKNVIREWPEGVRVITFGRRWRE